MGLIPIAPLKLSKAPLSSLWLLSIDSLLTSGSHAHNPMILQYMFCLTVGHTSYNLNQTVIKYAGLPAAGQAMWHEP